MIHPFRLCLFAWEDQPYFAEAQSEAAQRNDYEYEDEFEDEDEYDEGYGEGRGGLNPDP